MTPELNRAARAENTRSPNPMVDLVDCNNFYASCERVFNPAINRRMGQDTVFYAGSGIKRDWAAFANMKTQAFPVRFAATLARWMGFGGGDSPGVAPVPPGRRPRGSHRPKWAGIASSTQM